MSDVKDILDSVLHDEKLLGSRAFRDKVYTDQPIIKRASQIKTPETPQKIKDMKALAYTPEAYWKTSAWLFYTQGKFMEDYTDVYEYTTDFVRYYPTYRDLDTDQLRGYFSWRSRLRRGEYQPAPIPFVYMRAYELINGIGAESPQERVALLEELWNEVVADVSVGVGECGGKVGTGFEFATDDEVVAFSCRVNALANSL